MDPSFVDKFYLLYVDDVSLGGDDVNATYELYLRWIQAEKICHNSAELH